MEQKDYLLREIEKTGTLLRWIIGKITGIEVNDALTAENQFEKAKELVLNETGFDMDLLLELTEPETEKYIAGFNGINIANLELLADIYSLMGMRTDNLKSKEYLKSALKLYELCDVLDKTFLFDRENKINGIKNVL